VLTLCVIEGYSEREAAEALGVAVGTVKSRLSRARGRLAASVAPALKPTMQGARDEH
jgi:RNA polymerase sigma-70 factor (ECF subfamily)